MLSTVVDKLFLTTWYTLKWLQVWQPEWTLSFRAKSLGWVLYKVWEALLGILRLFNNDLIMYVCNYKHEKHSSVFPDFLPVPMKIQVLGFTHYRSCVFLQNLHYASRSPITSELLCSLNVVVWMRNGISFEDMQFAKGVWRKLWNYTKLLCFTASFF